MKLAPAREQWNGPVQVLQDGVERTVLVEDSTEVERIDAVGQHPAADPDSR